MKKYNVIATFLLFFMLFGCKKEDVKPEISSYEAKRLISAESIKSYSSEQIQNILFFAETQLEGDLAIENRAIDGVKIYEVKYASEYINDPIITLSGLVCIPDNSTRDCLLFCFQPGTMSAHNEAPSVITRNGQPNVELQLLQAIAGLGFVIIIPDYIGFGASEDLHHPYYNKELFQRSIYDLILTTLDMKNSGKYNFSLNGDLFITGYSLGGWASLVAHKHLENNPITGLNFIGSACGAGAYDLIQVRDLLVEQTFYSYPFYIPNLLIGYQSVGDINYELSTYLNEAYASRSIELITGEYSATYINTNLTTNTNELLTEDFINDFYSDINPIWIELRSVLAKNSQAAWNNTKLIELYHGDEDDQVPYAISEKLVNDFRSMGIDESKVNFFTLAGEDHGSGVAPMYLDVLNKLLQTY
jgi:hypothetical protein